MGRGTKSPAPGPLGHLWVQPWTDNDYLNLKALFIVLTFLTVWELSGVRLSIQLSVCKHFFLSHLSKTTGRIFGKLVRMFPSVSSCASTRKNSGPSTNMAAVGHLWFFLLSHLLRNYWVDSKETCLLGSPQGLVVQAPNQILVGRQISHFWLQIRT